MPHTNSATLPDPTGPTATSRPLNLPIIVPRRTFIERIEISSAAYYFIILAFSNGEHQSILIEISSFKRSHHTQIHLQSARGHDRLSPSIDEIAVCYLFFLPTLPIPPIGNQETANESDLAPPPIRCSISDGEETDTDHDAEYPNDVVNLESAMVNPPPNISPAVRLTSDPKVYLDDAWKFLKPALTSILDEEDTDHFSFAKIYQVSSCCFENKVGEALFKLIVEECGAYISTTLESLAVHCNDDDDDPSLLLLPLEKFWLEYEKFGIWVLSFYPQSSSWPLKFVTRLGKSVNLSLLKNLMLMLNGSVSRELRFLEKPFLDSTAEFYAAEAKQVLEQSSDLPRYLKHVDQRVGEEKKKCKSLPLFSRLQDELLEVVNRELLGVHACAILEKADLVGHINDALSSYICKTGEKILKEEASSLAEFKARVDKICFRYFHDDPLLEKTVQTCFEGLGMSFVPTEEMLELGSSGPFPTSHWCF
ncbi:hypothetical protein Bca4012_000805 [Brassica carinata]